ncbi:MAG: IS110 family transposase [Acidobacteria bacterium]|nr:IS110 family transposase [Acidobacteriota bacterium]
MEQAPHFAAYIGIDWSDQKHDVCVVDSSTGYQELTAIKHQPEAIAEWALGLRTRFKGALIAVCLEQSRGPLIYALLKYDFLVLYPVNPKTLSKFVSLLEGSVTIFNHCALSFAPAGRMSRISTPYLS